jgi:hypothetical protein
MAFNLGQTVSYVLAAVVFIISLVWFICWYKKYQAQNKMNE